jgi:hypothetical protein
MPASLSPTLAFASFITHAQILMPTMHAEILRLKNVREIDFPDLNHCKQKTDEKTD